MALSDVRQTVIQIVNRVQRKLAVNTTTSVAATKHATVLLDLLNEVQSDLADAGDWNELVFEADTTAVSSVATYEIAGTSAVVNNVKEIGWDTNAWSLDVVSVEDIRQLGRVNSFGQPNQFSIIGTGSAGNPKFRVWPVPASAEAGKLFHLLCYQKPSLLTTADTSAQINFPADVVFHGLYAKALLEENSGEPNPQFQTAYAEYERMKREALNRYTSDTGFSVTFTVRR